MDRTARPIPELIAELVEALPELVDGRLMLLLDDVQGELRRRNDIEDDPGPWNPWVELRRRWPRVTLEWRQLDRARGLCVPQSDGTTVIQVDCRLVDEQPTRRKGWRVVQEVLTHELTHDDRRGFYTEHTDPALVAAEEQVVWAITRERIRSQRNGTPAPSLDRVVGHECRLGVSESTARRMVRRASARAT